MEDAGELETNYRCPKATSVGLGINKRANDAIALSRVLLIGLRAAAHACTTTLDVQTPYELYIVNRDCVDLFFPQGGEVESPETSTKKRPNRRSEKKTPKRKSLIGRNPWTDPQSGKRLAGVSRSRNRLESSFARIDSRVYLWPLTNTAAALAAAAATAAVARSPRRRGETRRVSATGELDVAATSATDTLCFMPPEVARPWRTLTTPRPGRRYNVRSFSRLSFAESISHRFQMLTGARELTRNRTGGPLFEVETRQVRQKQREGFGLYCATFALGKNPWRRFPSTFGVQVLRENKTLHGR